MTVSFKFSSAVAAVLLAGTSALAAEKVVSVGGGRGLLDQPTKARGSIILMPGGDGDIGLDSEGRIARGGNTLVRERKRFAAAGFATLTLDRGSDPGEAVRMMASISRPVTVVGMSRAATRLGSALSVRPDRLVLVSAMLDALRSSTSPEALPATLVVAHREDGCRVAQPGRVEPFRDWAGGRVRIVWLSGGRDEGDPCQARGHHGLAGVEGGMVSAVVQFARNGR